jgi:hypothetical protein
MERVVLSFRFRCSDDEGGCMSRAVPARHREETAFLSAGLHLVVLLYQGKRSPEAVLTKSGVCYVA